MHSMHDWASVHIDLSQFSGMAAFIPIVYTA
jgi:hypothetical protein